MKIKNVGRRGKKEGASLSASEFLAFFTVRWDPHFGFSEGDIEYYAFGKGKHN